MITLFLSSFSVSVKALRSESKCFAQPETCDDLASSCDLQPNSAADYFMVMQVIALTNKWLNGSTDLTINHKSHHNCVSAHDDPTVIKSHSKLFVNIYNTLWWHLGYVTQQPFFYQLMNTVLSDLPSCNLYLDISIATLATFAALSPQTWQSVSLGRLSWQI